MAEVSQREKEIIAAALRYLGPKEAALFMLDITTGDRLEAEEESVAVGKVLCEPCDGKGESNTTPGAICPVCGGLGWREP